MMIRESIAHALAEPVFEQRGGEFVITVWRDWLTEVVLAELGITERQKQAIQYVKENGRITNSEYQTLLRVAKRTAHRDLTNLIGKGVLKKVGMTGSGTYYELTKGAMMDGSMIIMRYATISGPRNHMLSMSRVKGAKGDIGKCLVIPMGDGLATAHKWPKWLNAGGKSGGESVPSV